MTTAEEKRAIREYRAREARNRVARGAKYLDKHEPDWWKSNRIKMNQLRMRHDCLCVIGQLHGTYGASYITKDLTEAESTDRGFYIQDSEFYSHDPFALRYSDLDHAWRDIIRKRRQAARQQQ